MGFFCGRQDLRLRIFYRSGLPRTRQPFPLEVQKFVIARLVVFRLAFIRMMVRVRVFLAGAAVGSMPVLLRTMPGMLTRAGITQQKNVHIAPCMRAELQACLAQARHGQDADG